MSRLPKNKVNAIYFFEAEAFTIDFDSCNDRAEVVLTEQDNQSVILLTEMHNRCPNKVTPEEARQFFEKEFIERLRDTSVTMSPRVSYIQATRLESSPSPSQQRTKR